MFPLLFGPEEYPVKLLLLAIHSIIVLSSLSSLFSSKLSQEDPPTTTTAVAGAAVGPVGMWYLAGFAAVEVWGQLLHPLLLGERLPFLPLMLVSTYCAFGMVYSWTWQLRRILAAG